MENNQGRMQFAAGIDNSRLRIDAAESRNILSSIGNTANNEGIRIETMLGKAAKAAGGLFALNQAKEFAREVINVRGEIESLETSFETLAGKTQGNALFGEIRQFAVQTPMMMKDLAAGAQTMLAFNIEAENVMPILRAIGDISMGDAQKFNSLSLAFSQMSATGKLMGQDLLQMINAGFNPLAVISEKTGKSIGELKKEMEAGKISTQMVTDAFLSATSAGGKFYGMLEKQSHGVNGAISNLQGAIEDTFNDLGAAAQGTTVEIIGGATNIVKHYKEIGEVLAVIVGAYGTYRAALIANEAIERLRTEATAADAAARATRLAAIEAEIAAIGVSTSASESATAAQISELTTKHGLTEAEAVHVVAIKAEAAARVEALQVAARSAAAAVVEAQTNARLANQRLSTAANTLAAKEAELVAAKQSGDVFRIHAAEVERDNAALARNAALAEADAAAKAVSAARTEADAAAKAADTAATDLNSVSTDINTTKTNLLTAAKTKLANAAKKAYATLAAHPYALAAAAVVALCYGIYKLVTYETEAEKAQKRLKAATDEVESSIAAEQVRIDVMFDRLRKAKEGTERYKQAKQDIIDQYGNYLSGLSVEIATLKDVEGAYNAITEAAKKAARARAMETYVKQEGDTYAAQYKDDVEKIKKIIAEKYGKDFAEAQSKNIADVISGKMEWGKDFYRSFNDESWGATYNDLQMATIKARSNEAQYQRTLKEAPGKFGLEEDQKPEDGSNKDEAKWKDDVAAQRKKLSDAQAEVKKLQAGATATTTEVKAAQEKVEAAKKALKELGVDVSAEQKSGARASNVNEDNTDMLAKDAAQRLKQGEEYTRRLADQAKDNELEIAQAKIDAMNDGIDKELRQNELNYDKFKEQNARRLRDMLDAVAEERLRLREEENPLMFKRADKDGKLEDMPDKRDEELRRIRLELTVDDLAPEQKAAFEEFGRIAAEQFKKGNDTVRKEERNAWNEYLEEYGTVEQQRAAIAELYSTKLADATNQAMRERIKREAKSALDTFDFEHDIEKKYSWAFSEIGKISKGTIDGAIDAMEKLRDKVYQTYDPALIEKYDKAMQRLKKAQKGADGSFVGRLFVPEEVRELQKAMAERDEAQRQYNALVDKQHAKEGAVKNKIQEIAALIKKNTGREVKEEEITDPDKLKGITDGLLADNPEDGKKLQGLSSDLLGLQDELQGVTEAADGAKTGLDEMIAGIGGKTLSAVGGVIGKINESVQSAKALTDDLKNTADALGADTEVGSGWSQASVIMDAFAESSQGMSDAFQSLISLNPIGVIQGIVKAFTSWIRGIAAFKDAKHERQIINLQEQIDKLEDAYTRLNREIDKCFSADASKLLNQQAEMIDQQIRLIELQIAEEKAKKNTDWDKIEEWETSIKDLKEDYEDAKDAAKDAIFGNDIKSAIENFADAYADAWASVEDRSEAAQKTVKNMMRDMVKESIKAAIQSSGAMEEIRQKLLDFYKDGVLSEWEQNTVMEMAKELDEKLNKQFAWADSLMTDDEAAREGSKKGIATASQDSIDELNGRMTAVQGHTFSISENIKAVLAITQAILLSLMNIESETNGLGSRLEKMEGHMRQMSGNLDDIATKGVRLKN